jgi:hypothetical protein
MCASGAAGASAETLPATCETLQAQVDAAATSNGSDTVVLNGMCKMTVTLRGGSSFTLEGAPGTTSGLNGEGISGTARLLDGAEEVGTMTISDLTFEHADTEAFDGGAVELVARSLTLSDDRFIDDTAHDAYSSGGGAYVLIGPLNGDKCEPSEPNALTIAESSFVGDEAKGESDQTGHGGGLDAIVVCPDRSSLLTRDSFEDDRVETTGSGEVEGGGAAFLDASTGGPALLRQEDDVFDSNAVVGPAEGNRGGGGEWLEAMNLTSIGDRFSRNSIPGTSGSKWSWGGGLGILNTTCQSAAPTESTLEDAVVASNSIGAGTPADLGGAGIYVGIICGPEPEHHSHLKLLDSTVTENTVASTGGTAGIDGHAADQLELENSIVEANDGGSEITGFNGAGGSLTSAFSDVCDEAGTAPLTGEGDICAAPKLADEGSAGSYEVQETLASPTIDAGSNALVPDGLTSDFYGQPRIAASNHPTELRILPQARASHRRHGRGRVHGNRDGAGHIVSRMYFKVHGVPPDIRTHPQILVHLPEGRPTVQGRLEARLQEHHRRQDRSAREVPTHEVCDNQCARP